MVTKQEVMDHYATIRGHGDPAAEICPSVVKEYLSNVPVDETGHIFNAALTLCVDDDYKPYPKEYRTLEDIKQGIRAYIKQNIKDLQKIAEI